MRAFAYWLDRSFLSTSVLFVTAFRKASLPAGNVTFQTPPDDSRERRAVRHSSRRQGELANQTSANGPVTRFQAVAQTVMVSFFLIAVTTAALEQQRLDHNR